MNVLVYAAIGLVAGAPLATMGCGSSGSPSGGGSGSGSIGNASSGSGESSGTAFNGSSGSSSGTPGSSGGGSGIGSGGGSGSSSSGGPGGGSGKSSGSGSENSSGNTSSGSSSGSSGGVDAGPACVKGQVQANEVVMLGDSYLDIGNVGPTIQQVAGAMYRTYYQAGAALNYGTGQGNIPTQFDSLAVPASADIKVVIMDGGGNDVLINNSQCLSTAVAGDTACHMAIDGSVARGKQLLQDMASKGVQHIVFFFYPHIDPSIGADANDWLDYAYFPTAQLCCGASTPAQGSPDYTCHANAPGTDCVFVDTRPEFVGHNMSGGDYWFQDGIHPTQPGADAIAAKVWAQMQKYCIAQ